MMVEATSTDNRSLAKLNPQAASVISDWAHESKLLCCRVDPTGKYVVSGAIDYTIQRWDIATGKKTLLAGHDNWVRALGFSPDGAKLYSGAYDGRLIVWDIFADNPRPQQTVQAHQGWLRSLAVSHDGQRLATCGNDKLIKVWSTVDGKQMGEMAGHPNVVYSVQFVPGTYEIVSGDIVGNIFHWRGDDNALIRKLDAADMHSNIGDIAPFGGIIHLTFSLDGQRIIAAGLHKVSNAQAGNRRAVAASFDWKTGQKLIKQESLRKELDATMWRAFFHPDGTMIGIIEKEIGFWNPGVEDVFHLFATPEHIFDCDLHPNHMDLYTAHFDGHLRCVRIASSGS
jgi:WD40 repeat protein